MVNIYISMVNACLCMANTYISLVNTYVLTMVLSDIHVSTLHVIVERKITLDLLYTYI